MSWENGREELFNLYTSFEQLKEQNIADANYRFAFQR